MFKEQRTKKIFISFLVFILIFAGIIFALPKAPTNLIFSLNSTQFFDGSNGTHGVFYLNWTNNSLLDSSFNIYISIDGGTSFFKKTSNTSAYPTAGLKYFNTTEANYTFIVEAVNATGATNSTTKASMTIDLIAPIVKVLNATGGVYQNASTFKNANSSTLTLNVSVSDSSSGVANSMCIFDINGTNETVAVSNGWCNSSKLNLTGLSEGNHTIKVWANDTVNNLKLNNSFVVWIDTINPSPTASCANANVGDSFPCSCSGSDSGSGVSSNTGSSSSPDGTSTPTLTGTFTYTCNLVDRAGNTDSTTCSYTINSASGIGIGSGASSTKSWSTIIAISNNQFKQGYTKKIASMQRIRFEVEEKDHHFGVKSISGNTATIEISSTPQEANIAIGDTRKFDVSGDNYYDLSVTLNGIENGKADFTILSIYEEITLESEQEEIEKETQATEPEEIEEQKDFTWLWIILGIVLLIAIVGGIIAIKNNTKKR